MLWELFKHRRCRLWFALRSRFVFPWFQHDHYGQHLAPSALPSNEYSFQSRLLAVSCSRLCLASHLPSPPYFASSIKAAPVPRWQYHRAIAINTANAPLMPAALVVRKCHHCDCDSTFANHCCACRHYPSPRVSVSPSSSPPFSLQLRSHWPVALFSPNKPSSRRRLWWRSLHLLPTSCRRRCHTGPGRNGTETAASVRNSSHATGTCSRRHRPLEFACCRNSAHADQERGSLGDFGHLADRRTWTLAEWAGWEKKRRPGSSCNWGAAED